jgi:hypothetical protein
MSGGTRFIPTTLSVNAGEPHVARPAVKHVTVPKAIERLVCAWERCERPAQPAVRWQQDRWIARYPMLTDRFEALPAQQRVTLFVEEVPAVQTVLEGGVDEERPRVARPPRAILNVLPGLDDRPRPWLPNR